jgi:hypothetical protein
VAGKSPKDLIADAAASAPTAPDMRAPPESEGSEVWDVPGLPPDCPIQALGHRKLRNYLLDYGGQLIDLPTTFQRGDVMQIFGPMMPWAARVWPSFDKQGVPVKGGFNHDHARRDIILACTKRGLFDPTGKVRGRGAHRGEAGELILHCGNAVYIAGRKGARGQALSPTRHDTGLVGKLVFPSEPELPHPDPIALPGEVARLILSILESWKWQHGKLSAYLCLCWMAAAMVGGALKNRPHIWINGPSGAGKTSLQDLLRGLLNEYGVATEDATEAGLRQLLHQDTLAVLFDELEPDESNPQIHMKIVKLARLAYSGSSALRGGADHKSQSFTARSCFLFSSIHHHELPAQDRNRMAVLHLSKFPPDTPKLSLPPTLALWGHQMRRRLLDQWHRFDATLATYQAEMLRLGYSGREQDTYGTLLACGDLLLHDEAPLPSDIAATEFPDDEDERRVEQLVAQLAPVLDRARAEQEDTTERCLRHLTSHRLSSAHGQHQETVGRWLQHAIVDIIADPHGSHKAAAKLMTHGLKLVHAPSTSDKNASAGPKAYTAHQPIMLAVAGRTHKGMQEIFAGSMWQGGIWSQSLALESGAMDSRKTRFDGPPVTCTLLPIESVIDMQDAREEAEKVRQTLESGRG